MHRFSDPRAAAGEAIAAQEHQTATGMREFGTRTSFRPRPLDINRKLPIVRELSELDSTEGLVSREITHNHEALDQENEEVKALSPDKKGIICPSVFFSTAVCIQSRLCLAWHCTGLLDRPNVHTWVLGILVGQ